MSLKDDLKDPKKRFKKKKARIPIADKAPQIFETKVEKIAKKESRKKTKDWVREGD